MTELTPTQLAPKGVLITQFDHEAIETLGLVKIDLLGIRGLTVLGDVGREVGRRTKDDGRPTTDDRRRRAGDRGRRTKDGRQRTADGGPGTEGERFEWGEEDEEEALRVLEAIPEEDAQTSELLRTGGTIGCFQIESPGMRATLREIQARSVDDLMVALALYRPGPLTGGLKDAFVRRHRGEEPASQLHPALTPLLADTYGVILYQEQVLRIAHELAGLSLADADLLRRAMSHFDPGKQMILLREKFIAGATSRSGVPETVARRVWELMAAFAGYGFPKAHAASYAQVGWRAAWCKVHYPAVFMAAVLANWGGYYPQSTYLMEARRRGLALRPPHVNHALREFSVVPLEGRPVLFMGLDQVRDLTRRTQARIISQRPFHSLNDFLARADPRPIEAENLVRAGALEGLGGIPALLRQLKGGWQRGQLALFSDTSSSDEDWPIEERVAAQEAILGAGVTASRLELFARQIVEAGAVTTVEAAARLGGTVRVAGVRQTWHRSASTRGFTYFMSLEDLEGMLEVIIPAEVYRLSRAAMSGSGPYIVEGSVELNPEIGEPFIRAEKIVRL
jgi:DNA polymerase III alpha subunit